MVVFSGAFLSAFKPKSILTVSEWADRHRVLTTETSSVPGNWRTEFTPYLREPMDTCGDPDYKHIVLMFASQLGKALDVNIPVATTTGWKTQGTLEVGDIVFGADGKPTKVVWLSPIWDDRPCYEIEFSDGSTIIADENHEWYVEADRPLKGKRGNLSGITTTKFISEQFKYIAGGRHRNNFAIPVNCPIQLPEKNLPIDPYVLGAWLGDGSSASGQMTVHVDDMGNMIKQFKSAGHSVVVAVKKGNAFTLKIDQKDFNFCERGHDIRETGRNNHGMCIPCHRLNSKNRGCIDRGLKTPVEYVPKIKKSSFYALLNSNELINNKHVPKEYLRGSFKQRLSLLQGLMDTDGHVTKRGACEFVTTSEGIFTGFKELLSSLGIKYTFVEYIPETTYKGVRVKGKKAYCFNFMTYSELPIFRLERKLNRMLSVYGNVRYTETLRRRIIDVKRVESVPVRCIQVDSKDHLYLAGETMIPTHNSEAINNVSAYFIDQEPSPQMLVQPTLQTAKEYSQIRIGPMIKACHVLAEKVIDEENAKKGSKDKPSMYFKPYPGGYLVLAGSNSPASLASKPIRILLRDEIDRFPDSIPGEGSPLDLSEQRTRTFFNKKIVDSSTPLIKDESKIEAMFLQSDQRHYFVPCPHCAHEQELLWENVHWDKNGTDLERSKTAVIACMSCGEVMKREGRADSNWIGQGHWQKTAESDIAGFYLSALYSPLIALSEMVLIYLKAMHSRDEDKKQTFYNLMLGLPYEKNKQPAKEYEDLYNNRREPYSAEVPDEVCLLTVGVDVQHDRLEAEVVGWGRNWESWGIEYRVFMGRPEAGAQVWSDLDAWIQKSRCYSEGGELQVSASFIDSGDGNYSEDIYKFTKPRESRRIFSIKGHSRHGSPYISKPSKVGRVSATLFSIYTPAGKSKIWQRIHEDEKGAGYCHYPDDVDRGYNVEYFRGLLSEKYVVKREGEKGDWVKVRKRNEPFDIRNYAQAAAELIIRDVAQFDQLNELIDRKSGMPLPKPRRRGTVSKGVTM